MLLLFIVCIGDDWSLLVASCLCSMKFFVILFAVASRPTAGRLVHGLSDRLSVG